VAVWRAALAEQWGEEPADINSRFETLQRFCEFAEREPDAIIAECSREVEGGKRIRIKARREYSARIAEFEGLADGDARTQGRAGNVVRSFMIHNGVFIQAGVQT